MKCQVADTTALEEAAPLPKFQHPPQNTVLNFSKRTSENIIFSYSFIPENSGTIFTWNIL